MHNTLAVIFDFDDTLAPDSTTGFLQFAGLPDLKAFWKTDVDALLNKGWDPTPAYLYQMIQASQSKKTKFSITKEKFVEWGKQLPLHEGVPHIFNKLRSIAKETNPQCHLEFYLISSGIGDILRETPIAKEFNHIWASEFHYESDGQIAFPKKVISFTDKTRYLFHIQKGIFGPTSTNKPFEVNKKLKPEQIRVPFANMIFVGDGYTDIPCFSLIKNSGGVAIAVFDKNHVEKWGNAYQFSQDSRVSNLNSANYAEGSDLSIFLGMAVKKMANDFLFNKGTYQG
jgi:hypothetical protein